MNRATPTLLAIQLCVALCGCNSNAREKVDYSSAGNPLGTWPARTSTARTTDPPDSGSDARPPSPSVPEAGSHDAGPNEGGVDAGPEPTRESRDSGSDGTANEASPDTAPPETAMNMDARLQLSVLTQVQHLRLSKGDDGYDEFAWGPKNMGAIWVATSEGRFVRSLEVWRQHRDRSRHLQAYNAACECAKPDVTATPTLRKHVEHVVTWDMTDAAGETVPEGEYTLHIEVADYDVDDADKQDPAAANAELSIAFDTRSAPSVVMPDDGDYYSQIKLELFAP